jgi:hypothetical protein
MIFGKKKSEICEVPEDCIPVILSSICTGEKTIGFKNTKTGAIEKAVSMKDETDAELFCKKYGLNRKDVKVIY